MIRYETFGTADYDEAHALWSQLPGVGLSAADGRAEIAAFLQRNPGLSFVAREGSELVGTVLAGSDGRRGYLYHCAVRADRRGRGIGKALVALALGGLGRLGISKCHLFVFQDNKGGCSFWTALGWKRRGDLLIFSREIG